MNCPDCNHDDTSIRDTKMIENFLNDTTAIGHTGPIPDSDKASPTQAVTFEVTRDE